MRALRQKEVEMRRLSVSAVIAIAAALLCAAPAQAQATTTFVSVAGLDTNPCTNTAPCRSFARAITVTAAGGAITALDAAGYGTVTITKAISIVNDGGGEAGINDASASADAITISAGVSDVVNLRGLTLNGLGTGRQGIVFNSGAALNIQNCQVRNFAGNGITNGTGSSGAFTITDTVVSNNGGDGIFINAGSATVTAYLQRVAAVANGVEGTLLTRTSGTVHGTIVDSVAGGNGPSASGSGFSLNSGTGGSIALINSKAIRNAIGVSAGGTTYMSQTTLAGNLTDGFVTIGTGLRTFGDNYIIDTTNSGSLTPISTQ